MIENAMIAVQDRRLELLPEKSAYLAEDWGQLDFYNERPLVVEIQLSPILGQIGALLGEQFQPSVLDCDHCIFNHFKDV